MPANFLPVLIGLSAGILFILAIGMSSQYHYTILGIVNTPVNLTEFNAPNQLPEVKLLISKYPSNITSASLGRPDEKTVWFDYVVQKAVDTNGDGYRETLRRLELHIVYDESRGSIQDNPNATLLRINATCFEPDPSDVREWVRVQPIVQDGQVLDYIRDNNCII